ncbi:diguanylate cyclase [Cyanobium gracile]|uniref:Diguanylate cyclase n=1 Tax=Cyanobium gracile UHCC 0281 TaxID=3110309 RepID=A0ABU5SW97_9CYAN|nr:diguanylate cyclase [Cyanobium gracile]MEA5442806.1 diguanylate cyclase [Cyanobium gracile UHCC 0281]
MARENRFLIVNVITALGFATLALVSHVVINHRVQNSLRANLGLKAADAAFQLTQSVNESVRSMRGLTARLSVDPSLPYPTFTQLASQSFSHQDGLIIVEWQPIVAAKDRQSFEHSVRKQGGRLSDFHLWEPAQDKDSSMPARARDLHVPVLYVYQSLSSSSTTMGLDLAFSPERMESKWRSRDEGDPVASGLFPVIRFPGDPIQPVGFAVTVPVFRGGIIPGSLSKRQQQIAGFVGLIYDLKKLLIQSKLPDYESLGLNLTITQQAISEPSIKISAGPSTGIGADSRALIFDTPWNIRLDATQKYINSLKTPQDDILPWVIVVVGVMVLGFLVALERNVERLQSTRNALIESNALLQKSEQSLKDLAVHDPLTNLFNRRGFLERAMPELIRSQRYDIPLAILMLDLDHFKQVNDRWGHQAGDDVLQHVAQLFETSMRSGDLAARFGGEEFVILLSHAGSKQALQIAERLRQNAAAIVHHAAGEVALAGSVSSSGVSDFQVTVSIGIAVAEPNLGIDALLAQADTALYAAKASGRNRVAIAGDPVAPTSMA